MKIAIIGSGISGLGAAYLLSSDQEITVYEKNDYIGGHSRTIDVSDADGPVPVDTGFIVFNDWTYPNLTGLFKQIGVATEKSDMSFGVSIDNGWLEYSSSNLFAQRDNLRRWSFWRMLFDILVFNFKASRAEISDETLTLGACLDRLKMGEWFRRYYMLAMGAAIWSAPLKDIMEFPARTYIQFFKNHGLLNIFNRPQWYTVSGGSRSYVARLTQSFADRIRLNCPVVSVAVQEGGVVVTDGQGGRETYDHVIFACHGDEARAMIQGGDEALIDVLSAFQYQDNTVVTHCDQSFMPKNEDSWASWVYLNDGPRDDKPVVSLSYWMNNLQNLKTKEPVLVTLNPARRPDADKIYDEHNFSHPIFDEAAIKAQSRIQEMQGQNGLWFCGAHLRYGFHEDGLWSAVQVAKALGANIPWA